jgi:hypothetical protein
MEYLWDSLLSNWWFYLQLAMTIGMLVHIYRSGAEHYWFWIVLFFQPIGAWIYFFAVVVRGFRFSGGISWERKLSLNELQYKTERAPTVHNRTALAERLMELGRHREAIPLLEAVLAMDDIYLQPVHDLALCRLESGQPMEAVTLLKRLLERDPRWSNYRAWRTLVDAHLACNQPVESLKACRELARMAPTLENQCLLGEHLIDCGQKPEAIQVLDQALEDHAYMPFGKRLKNWRWARLANRLLKEAQSDS